MIKVDGIDFEISTLAPNGKFGYIMEYVEKKMISGKIRRIYKGRRVNIELNYGYLTPTQISNLNHIMKNQIQNGYVTIEVDIPTGSFTGQANIAVNNLQSRYAFINGEWVWTNYEISLVSTEFIKEE